MEEYEKTQVCSQSDCEHGGNPQPIKNFRTHPKSGTPFKMCNSCLAKRKSAGQQKRQQKKRQSSVPSYSYKIVTAESNPVEILFNDLPEVLNRIIEVAKKQERTPEAQVKYLLKTDYRLFREFKEG